MVKYEILTPGQKIKKLRKKIGATQQDIVGSEYTRNTLTMIENQKLKLTYETARVISDNINRISKEKNIKIEPVTTEYLMESFDIQCDKIALKYTKELDDMKLVNGDGKFKELKAEVDRFLEQYDLYVFAHNKFMMNYLIGENLLNHFMYDEAYIYAYKAYDIVMGLNDAESRLQVISLMIRICYRLNRITEIMAMGNHALDIASKHNINDSSALVKIYYNLALAYKKMGKFSECIEFVEKLQRLPNVNQSDAAKAKIYKANCYLELKEYVIAENMYLEILDEAKAIKDVVSVSNVYWNLAYINLLGNKHAEAEYYAEHLIYMDCKNDTEQMAMNFYWATYIYKETHNCKDVEKYLFRALNLLCRVKNMNSYYDLVQEVMSCYIKNEYVRETAELLYKIIEDMETCKPNGNYKDMIVGSLYKGLYFISKKHNVSVCDDLQNKIYLIDKYK